MSQNIVLEPRVYELGYHMLPIVAEADLEKKVDELKKVLADLGGLYFDEAAPEKMTLAYPMQKILQNKRHLFTQAFFGWIKFDVAPDRVEQINEWLDKQDDVLRYLLVSTVRENTFIDKKDEESAKAKAEAKENPADNFLC